MCVYIYVHVCVYINQYIYMYETWQFKNKSTMETYLYFNIIYILVIKTAFLILPHSLSPGHSLLFLGWGSHTTSCLDQNGCHLSFSQTFYLIHHSILSVPL